MEPDDVHFDVIFPSESRIPVGLPPEISRAYQSAIKVRSIDANAFGVLIRRVLELVAVDRSAAGNSLDQKLGDLAKRGEIPDKLAAVAHNIRKLGNVGAHAGGELSPKELPVLDDLCRGLLEFVYSAPHWVAQAEQRLASLNKKKKK